MDVPPDFSQTGVSTDTQLAVIRVKMDQLIEMNRARGEDHELRIRKLEERRFPLQAVAVLISLSALAAAIVGVLLSF